MLTLPTQFEELAELRQWVCYGPDKRPLRAVDGKPASVTNPQDWAIYADAANAASAQTDIGVGLVLTAQDDLVCVDLDSYKTSDPVIQQLHAHIENSLDTYCEESPNGGRHIWLKGSIPSSIKLSKHFVEMYDRNRYMTVTSKVVRDVPIKNCNGTLTKVWEHLKTLQGTHTVSSTQFESKPQTQTDEWVIEKCKQESTAPLFNSLLAGDTSQHNDDHSSADLSLMNLIAHHTDNKEQCIRIFQQSVLGQRQKGKRADYIRRTVDKAFDNKVASGVDPAFKSNFDSQFKAPVDPAFSIEGIKSIYDYDCKGIDYAINDFIACSAITLIASESGSGKTTVMSHAAHAIANGTSFLGYPAQPPRKVLFLDRENALPVLIERFERLGIKDSANFKYWGNHIGGEVPFPLPNIITEWVANNNPKPVVMVDSLIAFLIGKENSSDDIRSFFKQFDTLKALGAAIVVLHHSGKTENTKQYRGSSDIKGAIDNGYSLVNAGGTRLTNLTLTAFKTRFAVDESISMKYENGKLFNKDSKQQGKEILTDILFNNDELTTAEFEELAFAAGIKRGIARMFLISSCESGSVIMRPGEKHAKLYSLAHKVELQNMASKLPWVGS